MGEGNVKSAADSCSNSFLFLCIRHDKNNVNLLLQLKSFSLNAADNALKACQVSPVCFANGVLDDAKSPFVVIFWLE